MAVGSVELSVSLSLAQLLKDAQRASETIKKQIKEPEVKVKLSLEANSIAGLAKTLNGSFGEAQQFAKALGLTADQANAAIQRIGQLNAVGATTAEKYRALKDEFGLTATQMFQLGNAAKLTESQLKAQAVAVQNSSSNIANLANVLGKSYGDAQRFADGLGLTAQESGEAIAKLKELNAAGATTAEKLDVLQRELGITGDQFQKLNANLNPKGIYATAQAFEEAVSKSSLYTQALTQVGQQLSQTGAQINQFSESALGAAVAFDSAQAKVATLSDNAAGIASNMRDLSKELEYQANSTDLLNASYDVLSSGFSEAADISGILKASVDGSIGGFSSVGTVADATTTILNSYGDALGESATATEKATKVVDILAQTQDKGKITIDQYASQIGRVASIAASAGVGLEELSAAIATATAKGVPAESSISGIRQAIVNLNKPTDDAQKKLESFGIANASATLKSEGLIGVLQRLQDAGASNTDLGKIFTDVDALATVVPIAGANLDDFRLNLDAMNNSAGKAAKSAAAVSASFEGQTTAAFNKANEALVSLGNGIKGAALPLLQALNFLVDNFNALPEPIKGAIGVTIALAGGALTLAGALAAVAAILPSIAAGFKVMGAQGLLAGSGAGAAGTGAAAGSVGIKAMGTAIGGLLLKMGLMTVAMATLQSALSRFDNGGGSFKDAAGKIEKSLLDLRTEAGKTKEAIATVLPTEPPPTDFIDALVTKFNEGNAAINKAIGLPADFLAVPTDSQKRLEDARLGVSQLQQAMGKAIDTSRAFKGSQEEAKKVQEALTEALAAAKEQLAGLDPAKLGTKAYDELKKSLNGTVEELEKEKASLEQRTGLAKESGKASTDAAGEVVSAEKKAADAIAQTTDAYTQRTAELEAANKLREAEIKASVAMGLTTEAEGQKQLLEQQRSSGQERLNLAESQAAQLRDLLSSTTDPEQVKELNAQILAADGAVAEARLAIAENLAAEREAAEKAALDKIEKANRESEARITESQQARIIAVKQAQLAGTKTAEEAAAEIAAIEQDSIAQTIQARRDELAQVQSLRQQGTISAEEARDRELKLNEEIGTLNLSRIDKEIQAQKEAADAALKAIEDQKKATIEAIDAAANAAKAPLESQSISLDISSGSNDLQSGLLAAQLGQQQALAAVEQARFESAIQRAKLAGNDIKAEQIKLDQIRAQQKAQEQQFAIEKQQLTLAQAQRAIDLERQQIAAQIAAIEAEVAVQKAIASGASAEEVANLQTILGLRQKQVSQLDSAKAQQEQLNALESSTLDSRQAATRIQGQDQVAAQQRAIADASKPKENATTAKPDSSAKSDSTGSSTAKKESSQPLGPSAEEREKARIAAGRLNGFNAAGATLASTAQQLKQKPGAASVQQLKTPVPAIATQIQPVTDITGLGDALQTGNVQVVAELQGLRAAIEKLANTPRCVSVSAPDPVGAVASVLSDVGKASFRRAKL